jgi:hypothetical protein
VRDVTNFCNYFKLPKCNLKTYNFSKTFNNCTRPIVSNKTKLKDDIFIRNRDKQKISTLIDNNKICDSEIIRDQTKAYYLVLNYKCLTVNEDKKISKMSIDPGIKTLYNCYTKEGINIHGQIYIFLIRMCIFVYIFGV